jgi:hypothetical protein
MRGLFKIVLGNTEEGEISSTAVIPAINLRPTVILAKWIIVPFVCLIPRHLYRLCWIELKMKGQYLMSIGMDYSLYSL